jgi:hypothetical protein
MKMKVIMVIIICFLVGLVAGYFGEELMEEEEDEENGVTGAYLPYEPKIDPADFVEGVDNQWHPLTPGVTRIYEGASEDESIRIETSVLNETRTVIGVECTVMRDTEYIDGELVEDTYDWFAQDVFGNVWYFGEDSREYEDGKEVSTAGSWESGVDGALPGIIMFDNPLAGVSYRQEYYKGEAEDMAEVIGLEKSKTVAHGSYDNCLQTREWTPLEPGVEEQKYYAAGIGVIYEVAVKGDEEYVELVEIRTQ